MIVGMVSVFTVSCVLCDGSRERYVERVPSQSATSQPNVREADVMLNALEAGPPSTDESDGNDLPGLLRTVPSVDLKRYMGSWYEIGRFPNRYQRGIVGVIAEYTLQKDGRILVRNYGRSGSLDAELTVSTAKGWVADETTNAKWFVQFIWPFKADYWIIDLDQSYQYAVVGQPDRERLWILSRQPKVSEATLNGIYRRLRANGYDTSRIKLTPQRSAD